MNCPHCGQPAIGVVLEDVYVGVLFWKCPSCGGRWHNCDPPGRLFELADFYINGPPILRGGV